VFERRHPKQNAVARLKSNILPPPKCFALKNLGLVTPLHGRPQKFFHGVGNVDILLIVLKWLTMQCKWTFKESFFLSAPQRKCPILRPQSQKNALR